MAAAPDFNEMVDLLALQRSASQPGPTIGKVATLPLRDALILVVEDWADDKFRQLTALIVRPCGVSIRSLEEIRHLYAQLKAAPGTIQG